jgi:hypothetical protein
MHGLVSAPAATIQFLKGVSTAAVFNRRLCVLAMASATPLLLTATFFGWIVARILASLIDA